MANDSAGDAMATWPRVPPAYGWLGLDEDGRWRLADGPVLHRGLIAFLDRNYACDAGGRWFVDNGPQRVFVRLAYTPWVLHVDASGRLRTHTGRAVDALRGALVDDGGDLLLETDAGVGLVHADALPAVAEWLAEAPGGDADAGRPADARGRGPTTGLRLHFGAGVLALETVRRAEVPARFGFVPDPRPPADA